MTIEIPDALFDAAERCASARGLSLDALVGLSLRRTIEDSRVPETAFKLRKHPFTGNGLHPELVEADWSDIRALVYEGRGG